MKEKTTAAGQRPAKEITKRYILFIISLFIMALGVAVTKKGELGVSPTSSVANVLSIRFTMLSLGNWLIIWNCILILGQILVLRKQFQWIQLLQLPLSFIFGYFADLAMWMVSFFTVNSYPMRIVMVLLGTGILAIGVTMSVIANVIMNSGEAFVKAISDTIHKDFGSIKLAFDITNVMLAIVLSLVFCGFTVVGTREGTVIAALCTGWVVKFIKPKLDQPLTALVTD